MSKAVRHIRVRVTRVINDDRNQKRQPVGHVANAFDRQPPFAAKVALVTSVRVYGNEGHEENALVDLVADLLIPGVATPQFALI